MPAHSYLYVPADREDRLRRAGTRGADALIVDLEDAVPENRKDLAREIVRRWLPTAGARPSIWVRLNSGPQRQADLDALRGLPGIAGFLLAKTAARAEVEEVARALDAQRSTARLAPVLESAAAVLDARDIASAPRVRRLHLGEADLRAELGITPGPDETELLWVRTQVVLVSAAAGLEAPAGPVATNYTDLDALRHTSQILRRLGFAGRACIHPAQVPVVNDVFATSAAELAAARDLVARLDAAGGAATVDAAGQMIDEAVARRARRLLGDE